MNTSLYTITSQDTSPYANLALEEALLCSLVPGEVVLYLWQNADTIVIGKNQNAYAECRVDDFAAAGGTLARRLSGGGAVYHDLGNQNFTFLACEEWYDVARQTEVIRRAVRRFGIDAERSGRNDILAGGRKFSGNAFYKRGAACYHHGTVLVNSDMGRLGQFLQPSREKLAEKGVASVRARVVNLSELSGEVDCEGVRTALCAAFAEVYGGQARPYDMSRLDTQRLDALCAHYAADEWRLGRRLQSTWRCEGRFGFGGAEIQCEVRRGVVHRAAVYTDDIHPGWADLLARRLVGCAHTPAAMAAAVRTLCAKGWPLEELAQRVERAF